MANKIQGKFGNANRNSRVRNSFNKKVIKGKVQDARQKIIQKKRTHVVDARDVLAKMAKTKDARSKLNRIRENRGVRLPNNENVKVIGHNIVQKTDRNGKISLSTNKAKSGINLAVQKQLGLVQHQRPAKKVVMKRNAGIGPQRRENPMNIRKTIMNNVDLAPLDARIQRIERLYDANLYKWTKPGTRPASQLISSLEVRRPIMRNKIVDTWPDFLQKKPLRLAPAGYIDLDAMDNDEDVDMMEPMHQTISLQGSSRISNIHSRLDSHPVQPETHGILSQTKTKVVVPAGHRIVVSNLQPSVTQDDIKELFEDIGHLLAAQLVRPGVAEVIYKNLKDAQKAVDTYHNRQLDGQPMKCLLVNKRPLNHPTAPALIKTDSQGMLAVKKITSIPNTNKLVPDINTIHKVLFQRK